MDNQEVATQFLAVLDATDKEKPKPAELAQLRQFLTDRPELAAYTGDLAAQAMVQVLGNAYPARSGTRICVETFLMQMRDELGYEQAAAVERSLIEHVCLCWLRLHVTELRYEQNMQDSLTLSQGEYWEKKLSANQRRYLRAVETLAKVRKLMQPAATPLTMMLVKQQLSFRK